MSAKNCDDHNRWRNITVGFRVSPEENERLNRAVALSGLPKQEYGRLSSPEKSLGKKQMRSGEHWPND